LAFWDEISILAAKWEVDFSGFGLLPFAEFFARLLAVFSLTTRWRRRVHETVIVLSPLFFGDYLQV
jgi:hypothetical protein